MACNKTKESLV